MKKRTATVCRKTKETNIKLTFTVDGSGKSTIDTGIPFFDHMLTLFSAHGLFDLTVQVKGDIEVDFHHTVEDVGICLGQALRQALDHGKGIRRYASGLLPMDEALCQIAIDISGRPHLTVHSQVKGIKRAAFDMEVTEAFLGAFTDHAKLCVHISVLQGRNLHHILEACFKGLGVYLDQATQTDPRRSAAIPSTKGVL